MPLVNIATTAGMLMPAVGCRCAAAGCYWLLLLLLLLLLMLLLVVW
jgi:hypothetical protein